MLSNKVRDMNGRLARMVEREIVRRAEEERISQKAVISRDMGINYLQLNREYVENVSKIKTLEDEFK
jgi:hypothetical protein